MKAIINPATLLKELKKMSLVVSKNTILPVLKSVKFEFKKNKTTLTATDLETTYITTVECSCDKPFDLLMEFNDIVDVCGNLSAPLEINVTEKEILLTSGKWKGKRGLLGNAFEFPSIPDDVYYLDFTANGDFFYHLSIANTFKSNDDPRFNMAAIDIQKDDLTIVATDSNSLYKKVFPIALKKQLTIMISSNFIGACKTFQETKISIGEKFIKAEYGNDVIISRLSEQKFPNYRVVIRDDINYNLSVDRKELKSEIQKVSSSANAQYKQVVLNFGNPVVKLHSQDVDLVKESETEMEIENTVQIPEIGFNADKMSHFLNSLDCETLDFAFSGVSSSIYFKPSDDESVFCLLQPVVIQNN